MTQVPHRSVRNAFQLLELLAGSPDGLDLGRLATITGLPRTTAQRILATLEELDIVCHAERYHLSAEWQRLVSGATSTGGRAHFSAPILSGDGEAVAGLTLRVRAPLHHAAGPERLHQLVTDLAAAVSRRIV